MRAIRFFKPGGPLQLVEVDVPKPRNKEVLIKVRFAGINMIDTYHASGVYPVQFNGDKGSGLGSEAVGVVESVGESCTRLKLGDRVASALGPLGAYAEFFMVEEDKVVKVPDFIPDDLCAASLLKGMTARYLVKQTYAVKPGDWVLVYAAAGGTGQIVTQWCHALKANVIAVVSSAEKAKLVLSLGAHHAIITSETPDIAARVKEITQGRGVHVAYDSVGKDTFMHSLDSLQKRGMMVSYGNASGPVEPFAPLLLTQKGSLFLTRPKLHDYVSTREELQENADDLFDAIKSGMIKISPPERFALADAALAHQKLHSRATTGSLVLFP